MEARTHVRRWGDELPKLELTGISKMQFSERGSVRFASNDRIRGDVEITITNSEDAFLLAEFLAKALVVWSGGSTPEDVGYHRLDA